MATAPMYVTIGGGVTASGGSPVNGSTNFSALIGFGDSNIDSGYFFTHTRSQNAKVQAQYELAVQAGGGVPTDVGSAMNSTLLAQQLGVSAIPVGESGGTNYAASGATVTGSLPNSLAPSIVSQIGAYLSSVNGHADPSALYFISGGGNDSKIASGMSNADAQTYMDGQADKLATAIGSLYNAGAKYFLIDDDSGAGTLKVAFDNRLWADLSQAAIPFMASDTSALIPTAFRLDP